MDIRCLGYVGVESPAAKQWEEFGPDVLGLGIADAGSSNTVYLRMDDRHHRLAVRPGERDRLLHLGWDVGDAEAFAQAVDALDRAGISHAEGTDEECADRKVLRMTSFSDPVGFRHELFYGQLLLPPASPGEARTAFVTGDQGMGHAVVVVPDLKQSEQFYVDRMGFKKSDEIYDWLTLMFFHCNSRHHSLAMTEMSGLRGLHHVMLEAQDLDAVGIAYDLCLEREIPLSMTLGRHSNDRMLSFYVRTPSGFDIEYGWGGLQVDEKMWKVGHYQKGDIWGHKFVAQSPPGALERAVPA